MAKASHSIEMNLSKTNLLKAIEDFENYPKFVQGCSQARILKKGSGADPSRVEYTIEIMGKKLTYVLDHFIEGNTIRWELIESQLMKKNAGSWVIKEKTPEKLEVTYTLELELNFPVPGFVMNSLVKSSLPSMVSSFEKRAKTYGG